MRKQHFKSTIHWNYLKGISKMKCFNISLAQFKRGGFDEELFTGVWAVSVPHAADPKCCLTISLPRKTIKHWVLSKYVCP